MKAVFAFIAALLLSAPAFAVDLSGGAYAGTIIAGTLADANNPVEMALAPEYTRLAVLRQRTARLLRVVASSPESNPDALKSVLFASNAIQALADEARAKLDALEKVKEGVEFRFALDEARGVIKRGETLYDNLAKGN